MRLSGSAGGYTASTFISRRNPPLIDAWLERYASELGLFPYASADKIQADTLSYAQNLKRYGERFFMEFANRLLAAGSGAGMDRAS